MARRRKEKSFPEFVFGIFIIIVVIGVANPKLRQLMLSTFASILSITVVFGISGLVIYLINQSIKTKEEPLALRNPARNPVTSKIQNRTKDAGNFDIGISTRREDIPRQWDNTILKIIEWRRFEIITKEFLRMNGFEATETKSGADGGVDITIHKTNNPESKGIVQCKAWNTYKVGIKIVRELFGGNGGRSNPYGYGYAQN